jgi:hypothetical protein
MSPIYTFKKMVATKEIKNLNPSTLQNIIVDKISLVAIVVVALTFVVGVLQLAGNSTQDNPCPNGLVPQLDSNNNPVHNSDGSVVCISQQ